MSDSDALTHALQQLGSQLVSQLVPGGAAFVPIAIHAIDALRAAARMRDASGTELDVLAAELEIRVNRNVDQAIADLTGDA